MNVESIDMKSAKKCRRINFDKINMNVETTDMKSTKKLREKTHERRKIACDKHDIRH